MDHCPAPSFEEIVFLGYVDNYLREIDPDYHSLLSWKEIRVDGVPWLRLMYLTNDTDVTFHYHQGTLADFFWDMACLPS